ncbi:MAG: SDR family NAD(P)-dependent oxidoreductase, partial [bacterium]|nr:SDR family NAD(P)-dependent oxidoreductase [bacterium]
FGIVGIPSQTSYCATKFAVRGLSEALWEELRGTHIGVSVVHPGGVNTNIVHAAKSYDPDSSQSRARTACSLGCRLRNARTPPSCHSRISTGGNVKTARQTKIWIGP